MVATKVSLGVSEGGLEPLAYIAATGTDPWLSL
jgi:hypothetical protein